MDRADEVPDEPEAPEGTETLVGLFWMIDGHRQNGEVGPQPILPSEIEAYARLCGYRLSPDEGLALAAMETAYIAALRSVMAEAWDIKRAFDD